MISLLIFSIKTLSEILQIKKPLHSSFHRYARTLKSRVQWTKPESEREEEGGGGVHPYCKCNTVFSHLTFEKGTSRLCCMFGVSRNSILFHYNNFFFRDIDKARGGHLEN